MPGSPPDHRISGGFANAGSLAGHAVFTAQDWSLFEPYGDAQPDVVVVGGGVSGLCAAWKLRQAGVQRILLLELEDRLGGTSVAGQAGGQSFPWAAHYIHVPPAEADCVHEVLLDVGVISGYDAAGRPVVDPSHQLQWPHERLFVDGAWRPGLDPFAGGPSWEREELAAFQDDMLRWALHTGPDGRRAFAMPLAYSTREERVRALDGLSMAAYLEHQGWSSPRLRWWVDYACRDDYGAPAAAVSAWAGIHYWACRQYDYRFKDGYPTDVLTWPQGNAFLVDRLAELLAPEERRSNCVVLRIEPGDTRLRVYFGDMEQGRTRRVDARAVVFAAKLHTAPHVCAAMPQTQRQAMEALHYSPWVVAAVHLSCLPHEAGLPMAWDNIIYGSPSLGYVRADHQSGRSDTHAVLCYYYPLPGDPDTARAALLERPHAHWTRLIMADLIQAHPDLGERVERIDVYRWGHAMVRPELGVIWGRGARLRQRPQSGLSYATCDASGLPLFEEALYSGIRAAEEALGALGVSHRTSLGKRPHG